MDLATASLRNRQLSAIALRALYALRQGFKLKADRRGGICRDKAGADGGANLIINLCSLCPLSSLNVRNIPKIVWVNLKEKKTVLLSDWKFRLSGLAFAFTWFGRYQ